MIKNKSLKKRIIEISYKNKLSHIGSCLTAVDIIEEIYSIKKPDEKFILSAGHAHLAHLVVMEKYKRIAPRIKMTDPPQLTDPVEDAIKKYGIHCDREAGCDVSTGSLGHGIGIAVGMALTDRSKNVYCLLSDGELAEGSVYESLRNSIDYEVNNLKIYVNNNGWGAYRKTVGSFGSPNINNIKTNMNGYPSWLQGQLAHYKVLDKKEYDKLMEILK